MTAATMTPTEPSRSDSTSRNAPLTLRLSFDPAVSSRKLVRFTTRPMTATTSMGMPSTSGGSVSRW